MGYKKLGKVAVGAGALVLSAGLSVVLPSAYAQALHAHVHGQADLEVVVLDGQAMVSLISPADTLLGFEHLPQTDAQKKTVEQVRRALASKALFDWKQGKPCTLQEFDDADLARLLGPTGHSHEHGSDHEHMDLTVSWTYVCDPDSLPNALEVHLFDALPALEELHTAAVDADGQYAATLTPASRLIKFEAGL